MNEFDKVNETSSEINSNIFKRLRNVEKRVNSRSLTKTSRSNDVSSNQASQSNHQTIKPHETSRVTRNANTQTTHHRSYYVTLTTLHCANEDKSTHMATQNKRHRT